MFIIVAKFRGIEHYWSKESEMWAQHREHGTVFTDMNAAELERRYAETYGRAKAKAEVRHTQQDQ